jgi:hypothetical protein
MMFCLVAGSMCPSYWVSMLAMSILLMFIWLLL